MGKCVVVAILAMLVVSSLGQEEDMFAEFADAVKGQHGASIEDIGGESLTDEEAEEMAREEEGTKIDPLPLKSESEFLSALQLEATTTSSAAPGDSQQAYTVDPGVRVEVGSLWPSASVKGWSLLNGQGFRTFKQRVNFSKSFLKNPIVMASLRSFNILPGHNSRINVYAESVTRSGFTVVIQTWSASRVYSAGVTWAAYGQDPEMYGKRITEQRQVLALDREIRVRQAAHEKLRQSVRNLRSEERRAYQTVRSQISRMWRMRRALQAELKRVAQYEKTEFGKIRNELARMKELRHQLQAELDNIKEKEKRELGAIRAELDVMKQLRQHLKDEVKKLRLWERKRFSAIGYEMNELWQDQKNMQKQLSVLKQAEEDMRGEMDNLQPLSQGSGVVCHCGGNSGGVQTADLQELASTSTDAAAKLSEYFSQGGVSEGNQAPTNGEAGDPNAGKMCVCSGDVKDLELLTFTV